MITIRTTRLLPRDRAWAIVDGIMHINEEWLKRIARRQRRHRARERGRRNATSVPKAKPLDALCLLAGIAMVHGRPVNIEIGP